MKSTSKTYSPVPKHPRRSEPMGNDEEETLKLEINNLIWMNGNGKMTLEEAEELAVKIFKLIKEPETSKKEAVK